MVEMILQFVHSSQLSVHSKTENREPRTDNLYTIIDIGTGSGNIAISLAKNLSNRTIEVRYKIIATDISKQALRVAKQNAKLHGVEDHIKFIQSNLLTSLYSELITPDSELIIVTNLPYIPTARIPYLDSSVKDFEPHLALDGGENGFGLYEILFQQLIKKKLTPKLLIGEIDYTHGQLAVDIAKKYFPEAEIEVKKDLAYMQRILTIRLPG